LCLPFPGATSEPSAGLSGVVLAGGGVVDVVDGVVVVGVVGVVAIVVGVVSVWAGVVDVLVVAGVVGVVVAWVVAPDVGVPGASTTETTGEPRSPSGMLASGVPGATSTVTVSWRPSWSVTRSRICSAEAGIADTPRTSAVTPATWEAMRSFAVFM
jgi:hypothetical protein